MTLTHRDIEEGVASACSLSQRGKLSLDLSYSDVEATCVAFLCETKRYRREGTKELALDQAGAARADLRQNIWPLVDRAGPVSELPGDWIGLCGALYAGMIKPVPKDRRSDAVCLGAIIIAGIRARAHVRGAFDRAKVRSLAAEVPGFTELLREEMERVA